MAALGESEEGSSPSTNPVTTATAVPPPSALVRERLTALYCPKCACCVRDHMCIHMYIQAVPHMCTYRDMCVHMYVQAVPHMCTYRDVCVRMYRQSHTCVRIGTCVYICVPKKIITKFAFSISWVGSIKGKRCVANWLNLAESTRVQATYVCTYVAFAGRSDSLPHKHIQ